MLKQKYSKFKGVARHYNTDMDTILSIIGYGSGKKVQARRCTEVVPCTVNELEVKPLYWDEYSDGEITFTVCYWN